MFLEQEEPGGEVRKRLGKAASPSSGKRSGRGFESPESGSVTLAGCFVSLQASAGLGYGKPRSQWQPGDGIHYQLLQVIDYSSLCKNQYFQSLTHHAACDPDAAHLETSPNAKLSTQAQRETAGNRKRWRHPHAHRLGICRDFHIQK